MQVKLCSTSLGASLYAYPEKRTTGREIRSVALSTCGVMLAIGYEDHNRGLLELYDTKHNRRLLSREDPKVIT